MNGEKKWRNSEKNYINEEDNILGINDWRLRNTLFFLLFIQFFLLLTLSRALPLIRQSRALWWEFMIMLKHITQIGIMIHYEIMIKKKSTI
jgi:hypothetical protein